MKHLVNAPQTTAEVDFAGGKVELRRFTVTEVKKLSAAGEKMGDGQDFEEQLKLIRLTLRMGVIGAEKMTDKDFDSFAMADLVELVEMVMSRNGLGSGAADAGN